MLKLKTLAAAVAFLAASGAVAQEASAPECTDTRSATEILERKIREWKAGDLGRALAERDANRQLVLLVSDPQTVNAGTQSADYGKSRELAFRSEEHTSELQSRENLVCRLLLEKKNKK